MVKIWKVNIGLCNVLTQYLCTLFLVQGDVKLIYFVLKVKSLLLHKTVQNPCSILRKATKNLLV